jgi:hypothetical protein
MALTKLTSNLIEGGTGTDWVTAIQTSNFTAEAGKGYFVNTTSQVLYVNLPVGVVGMEITIQDYAGTFATNKVILNANGSEKIQGEAIEGRINTNNATAVLIYQDATKGWTSQDVTLNKTEISFATPTGQSLTYSTPSPQSSEGATATTFPTTTFTATKAGYIISGTATIAGLPSGITAAQTITGSGAGNTLTVTLTGTFPSTDYVNTALTLSGLTVAEPPVSVHFLVVAGGGAGNISNGGGAGAGGLRTSWAGGSGGGGVSESQVEMSIGSNYIVTIGAGGVQSTANPSTIASDGSDSIFYNITSNGGGAGGSRAGYPARTGGSGGGGGSTSGAGNQAAAGTANQGYAGRDGIDFGGYRGGGGGGAGAVGTWPNGGAGKEVNIIGGTGNYYAGGGGGGANSGPGSGGIGGGGAGTTSWTMNSGAANTGGGGGSGAMSGTIQGGNGGSGIVILRYVNTRTITIPGGLTATTTTDGSDKVTTFTAGTGNIQIN